MINFNTNKLIIVCYPPFAGGKFLINCLGLSDSAVMQHSDFAEAQLAGKFSQQDKFNYLIDRLSMITDKWDDLQLGCSQLFGIDSHEYLVNREKTFNKVVHNLTDSNDYYFFIVAHNDHFLRKYLEVWGNPIIIRFSNSPTFIKKYNRKFIDGTYSWTETKQNHWNQQLDLALNNRNDLVTIDWNTDWYLSKNEAISHIKMLYDEFNLASFNEEKISTYYDSWISALEKIRDL